MYNERRAPNTKQSPKASWIVIAGIGLGVLLLVIVTTLVVTRLTADSANDAATQPTATDTTGGNQNAPQSYSANGTCPTKGGCTGPQNQSQGQGQPPTQGTITAVSDNSISIRPSDGGDIKTFRVSSSTRVMKATSSTTYKASDFKIGQSVTVAPMLNDKTSADFIALDDTSRLNQVQE